MPQEYAEFNLVIVTGTVLLLVLVSFIVLFMLFYQRRYFNQERKINLIREESERELLKAQLEIQEVELKRVSQEIHDNSGQMLSLAKLNLNVIHSRMPSTDTNASLLKETKELIGDIINDLRNLSKSLSSDIVERLGFIKALQFETDRLCRTNLFLCDICVEGSSRRLNNDLEIILFRIAQESIQNIIKHSRAENVKISVKFSEESLDFSIVDDGIGFKTDDNGQGIKGIEGSGLQNIYSRAKLIGGNLTINSNQTGTSIQLKLPINKITQLSI